MFDATKTVEHREEQEKGGSRMLSEKPPLISEQVLFMVAGSIAGVLAIAAVISISIS